MKKKKDNPVLKNFTLMFVEDDSGTREQIQLMLQGEVKTFYQAVNGQEGLSVYEKERPDIILSDINMPVMNGLDMAQRIKEMNREQPILILSAFDEKSILLDAINIGIDGFIVKPIDMTQLNRKLYQIAQQLQYKIEAEEARKKALEEQQRKQMLTLYNLAHYDVLTKIPNRFLFNEKLHQSIRKSKEEHNKLALFFIDIDDFKHINDNYGHKAGDHTLVTITENIKKAIRHSDLFARIGGDEFALIIENFINKECLVQLSENIIKAVSAPIHYKGQSIHVSCSIGISQYSEEMNSEDLIHHADMAMYTTKSTGKSHYSFYEEQHWN